MESRVFYMSNSKHSAIRLGVFIKINIKLFFFSVYTNSKLATMINNKNLRELIFIKNVQIIRNLD